VTGHAKILPSLIIMNQMALVTLLALLLLFKFNLERISSVSIPVKKMRHFILTEPAPIPATFLTNIDANMIVISAIILVLDHKRYILMAVV